MSEPATEPETETTEEQPAEELRPEHIRALRLGHGANCSSVGSVIDTLFVTAAVGGAIFAAVCAALSSEAAKQKTEPADAPEADPDK